MKLLLLQITTAAALVIAGEGVAADGKEVYTKACALCHNNLPPKITDKAVWEPRLKLGVDAMVASVIKGKGSMPPNGGNASLSEADIKAAVEYMVTQVK